MIMWEAAAALRSKLKNSLACPIRIAENAWPMCRSAVGPPSTKLFRSLKAFEGLRERPVTRLARTHYMSLPNAPVQDKK